MTNFEPRGLLDRSDKAILDEVRRVAVLLAPQRLTVAQFDRHAKVGRTTLCRRFGSWRAALESAGLSHLYSPPARTCSLSDEELIAELHRVTRTLEGRTPTRADIRRYATPGVSAYERRFGSIGAALRAAKLTPSGSARRYTDEECFENLLSLWTHYGRQPHHGELSHPPSIVGPKAYICRWGTWRRAIAAFLARVQSSDPQVVILPPPEVLSPPMRLQPEDRRDIPLSLRYRVLKRDSFACRLCGRSPATSLDCELHVDHIHPFSKGGKTTESNLRALCKECNLGKGSTE